LRLRAPGRRLPVRVVLMLWGVGVVGAVLLILGGAVRVTVRAYLLASVDRELATRADFFAASQRLPVPVPGGQGRGQPARVPLFGAPPPEPPRRPRIRPNDPYFPRTFRVEEEGSAPPPPPPYAPWDEAALERARLGEAVYSTVRTGDESLRILSAPLPRRHADSARRDVVQMPFRLTDIERGLDAVDRTLLALLPLALLATAGGGALLTSRALRPIEEALAQEKRFVADASHELRTPLAIIRAAADLGLEAGEGEAGRASAHRALERIDAATERGERIVADLLLLARAERDDAHSALALDLRPVPVGDLLRQAAELFEPVRGGRVISLDVPDPALCVLADRHHLGRVLSNLIDNAVRHTAEDTGRITLTARAASGGRLVALSVTDNGTGVPTEELPHLFRRFYRADASRTRSRAARGGGAGLGLAIARAIVEAHRGMITLRSVPGVGTSVLLTLPARKK
jgi:Signal transduction histidine kinase